ncbi:MAG: PAS domain-containing protein [Chloroflexi bacterium]|nr:PAS domain-containing protein [Chloroflexota bacterium]MBA3626984.1 PAS domain-containing protein [Chloroflexota bacterium]MBA3801150.1 PAS domain-containing protein [Geodermatophilaceae bacterium]
MTKRRSLAGGKSDILESPLVPRVGLLMDSLPEAVVTTDRAHRITGWNNAAERLFASPGRPWSAPRSSTSWPMTSYPVRTLR